MSSLTLTRDLFCCPAVYAPLFIFDDLVNRYLHAAHNKLCTSSTSTVGDDSPILHVLKVIGFLSICIDLLPPIIYCKMSLCMIVLQSTLWPEWQFLAAQQKLMINSNAWKTDLVQSISIFALKDAIRVHMYEQHQWSHSFRTPIYLCLFKVQFIVVRACILHKYVDVHLLLWLYQVTKQPGSYTVELVSAAFMNLNSHIPCSKKLIQTRE